jgi:hypothetical protein
MLGGDARVHGPTVIDYSWPPEPLRLSGNEPSLVGTWLSLVEHSLGVRGVGSSNLPVPTNQPSFFKSACFA